MKRVCRTGHTSVRGACTRGTRTHGTRRTRGALVRCDTDVMTLRAERIALIPLVMSTLSENGLGEPCATWQLVQTAAPALKQPLSVSACGRLNRFGRPSGQNSP